VTVVGIVAENNGPVRLEILGPSNNDLRTVERIPAYMQEHARETTWTGGSFVITPRARYNPRLALVGDLRAAFIAAFATFGYRYAFNPRLTPVRQQILHPEAQIIDGWSWSIAANQTENARYLVLLAEPFPAVIAKLGSIDVLLPWLSSPLHFYDVLATTYIPNGSLQGSGECFAWPTTLEMMLDLQ
jgi:hypothetical protein